MNPCRLSTADSLSSLILKVIFQLPAQCCCLNLFEFFKHFTSQNTVCVSVCTFALAQLGDLPQRVSDSRDHLVVHVQQRPAAL